MNVFRLFKSISSSSEGDNNHSDDSDRNALAGSSQGKSRENGLDAEVSIYDWINPKRRERQVVGRFNEAMRRLEEVANHMGKH